MILVLWAEFQHLCPRYTRCCSRNGLAAGAAVLRVGRVPHSAVLRVPDPVRAGGGVLRVPRAAVRGCAAAGHVHQHAVRGRRHRGGHPRCARPVRDARLPRGQEGREEGLAPLEARQLCGTGGVCGARQCGAAARGQQRRAGTGGLPCQGEISPLERCQVRDGCGADRFELIRRCC